MTLGELLSRLAKSELKNLSLTTDEGEISTGKIPEVVGYATEGLLRLHSRFVLREDDVLVEMVDGISTYELKAKYALSYELPDGAVDVPHRYIVDIGPKKFADDVIRITGATDSLGHELELNNQMAPASVFTPRPKVLQVPLPIPGEALSIVYQAKHPSLDPEDMDQEIEIPEVLVGGLAAYVGFLAFNSMGGVENQGRAAGFMQVYDKICLEMEQKDSMGTETRVHSDVFEMRGFI